MGLFNFLRCFLGWCWRYRLSLNWRRIIISWLNTTGQKVTGQKYFPAVETNLCDWCEYYTLCPAKGGPVVAVVEPETEPATESDSEDAS